MLRINGTCQRNHMMCRALCVVCIALFISMYQYVFYTLSKQWFFHIFAFAFCHTIPQRAQSIFLCIIT